MWCKFTNGPARATINISGPIADQDFWGDSVVTSKNFIDQLAKLGSATPIDIYIQSPGGVVTEGLAIYNAIKSHQGEVTCYVRGLAASMASVIAMAADKLIMPAASFLMIHRVSGGVMGDADDVRSMADAMETIENSLVDIYTQKTGMAEEVIRGMLAKETWISGAQAVEMGFADECMEIEPAARRIHSATLRGAMAAGLMVPMALLNEAVPFEAAETTTTEEETISQPVDEPTVETSTETATDPVEAPASGETPVDSSEPNGDTKTETEKPPENKGPLDRLFDAIARVVPVAARKKPTTTETPETVVTPAAVENTDAMTARLNDLSARLQERETALATLQAEFANLQAAQKSAEMRALDLLGTFGFSENDLIDLPGAQAPGDDEGAVRAEISKLQGELATAPMQAQAGIVEKINTLRGQLK